MYHPPKHSLGKRGEQWAVAYLKRKNYRVLECNYTNPLGRRLGEIDIIAQDHKELVFIEVKTRQSHNSDNAAVLPEENISRAKLRKLAKIAEHYLRAQKSFGTPYRFDALALSYVPSEKKVLVRHLKNIFYS